MKNDIYTLAHEIRNPLCVVKGYLEMLDETNITKYKKIASDDNYSYVDIEILTGKKNQIRVSFAHINC